MSEPIDHNRAREVAHAVRKLEVLREQIAEQERRLAYIVVPGDVLEFVYDGRIYHVFRAQGAATVSYRPTVAISLPLAEVPVLKDRDP